MDKNVQKEEGISLMDIVRLLLSKIKLLILLVIIGGFIGGCFSVWQTKDVKYYGSNIRFYVNPENPTMSADGSGLNTSGSEYGVYGAYGEHIMDNMVKLLNEDAFAEEMLLHSQDSSVVPGTEEYRNMILKYSSIVTFSFSVSNGDEMFVRSFINADISVKGEDGYALAVEVYNIIKELVPEYVEAHMAIPQGYTGTNCQRISRNDEPQIVIK